MNAHSTAGAPVPRTDRKQRERARHRTQTLLAAEEAFAENGFHGAAMQEIAERAQFSVGYLYKLFEDKEQLYVELVEMRAKAFISELEGRVEAEESILGKVRASVEGKFDFFREHRRFFSIFAHFMADSRARGPVFMPESCRRRYQEYLEKMARIFADGIERGIFIQADPLILALCLEGATKSILAHWIYSAEEEKGQDGATRMVEEVFLNGVLREKEDR